MNASAITVNEILSIIERLHPHSLLLTSKDAGLDEDAMNALWKKLTRTFDPRRRLENIEYLLLIFQEACAKDRRRYLHDVFLPWVGIKRRLSKQIARIGDEFAQMKHFEAYTDEDAAHIATKIYRPLIADIFDPYATLIVATYQFIDGTFIDIHDTNVGLGERNKAELIEARIKKLGGPKDLLGGYDPIVLNALSHAGNEGVIYESKTILFKDIKRGMPPVVQTRRWTHDELHLHGLGLLELIMSIDAAIEVFGVDNMEILSERETIPKVLFHVAGREQRMEFMQIAQARLERIRAAENLAMKDRLDLLGKILFVECGERDIPCSSVGFNEVHKLTIVKVPVEKMAVTDTEVRDQITFLIQYAILARAVFGSLFERFRIDGLAGEILSMSVELSGSVLDEYSAETAGLIDLIGDAKVRISDGPIEIKIDEEALSAAEDERLGPRFPRRGRLVWD